MQKIYGIDYRALICFRIMLGLILLYDAIFFRLVNFAYFSPESGPFSYTAIRELRMSFGMFNNMTRDIHLILFLGVYMLIAVFLMIGVFPALMSFLACFIYSGWIKRYFPYYDGADTMLVSVLFVSGIVFFFVNIGDYSPKNPVLRIERNPAIVLLLFQILLVYWFNGINKTQESWWNGTAIDHVLRSVSFNRDLAYKLIDTGLSKLLTWGTMLFECMLIPFLLIPWRSRQMRWVIAVSILAFHWGIDIVVDVGKYKYIGTACALMLLPAPFWDRFHRLWPGTWRREVFAIWINPDRFFGIAKGICLFFGVVFLGMTVLFSLNRQYNYYGLDSDNGLLSFYREHKPSPASPFIQSWGMFAPAPPLKYGFFALERVAGSGNKRAITPIDPFIPGNNYKNYPSGHPAKALLDLEFVKINSRQFDDISMWKLIKLFDYEVRKDQIPAGQAFLSVYYTYKKYSFKNRQFKSIELVHN